MEYKFGSAEKIVNSSQNVAETESKWRINKIINGNELQEGKVSEVMEETEFYIE